MTCYRLMCRPVEVRGVPVDAGAGRRVGRGRGRRARRHPGAQPARLVHAALHLAGGERL